MTILYSDLLEWQTWGGGGLGDPLTRPAESVALEVKRKLVTVDGAKSNYGVIVPMLHWGMFKTGIRRDERLDTRCGMCSYSNRSVYLCYNESDLPWINCHT